MSRKATKSLRPSQIIPAQNFFRPYLDSNSEHIKMISLSAAPCWIPATAHTWFSSLIAVPRCNKPSAQCTLPLNHRLSSTSWFTLNYVHISTRKEESPQYKSSSLTCKYFWHIGESQSDKPDTTCVSLGTCHHRTFHFTLKSFYLFY